jgi:hypothetical protein
MEAFPTIENILEKTYISQFQKEISEMSEKNKIKLENEEFKALSAFRIKVLDFYEEHKEIIRGEYTAELEKLRKQLQKMLKDYNEEIIEIRVKHLKTKVPDEPLGIKLNPLPRRRIDYRASLKQRYIAGDDFKRDVERLPQKYQDKIESQTEQLKEKRENGIQEAREKRNEQRNYFWNTINKIGREYEQKKEALKDIDRAEEADMKAVLRRYEEDVVKTRMKYIELFTNQPNVEINSPEAESYEPDVEDEEADDAGEFKGQEPTQSKPPPKEKEKIIDSDKLYTQAIIQEIIKIKFNKLSNNMTRFFENYAEKKIESRCRNEGYVRMGSSSVITYSTGLLNSDSIVYNVVYSVDVCFPYENMEIECKIKNITKIGIRAIISEHNNPIVLFISREHNPDKDFDQYKENQIIKVKVLGHRFELNDEYISVIGELI